jgi:hypothetical protein
VRCWGTVRPNGAACDRTARSWLVLGNVRFAVCDRHAAANEDRRLLRMRSGQTTRRSTREAPQG